MRHEIHADVSQQMERFKALEKEMKMKAYSKEGLSASQKLDPAEKAKRDVIDWIGTTVDELSRQIEQTEAEMEAVQGGGKKKKAMGEKLGELEELNERRVWHNSKLEIVQRMLENGQLSVEQVEVIQEDIKYFVEANAVSQASIQVDVPPRDFNPNADHGCRRRTLTTMTESTKTSICKKRTNTCKTWHTTTSSPTSTHLVSLTLPRTRHLRLRHLHQRLQWPRLQLRMKRRKSRHLPSRPRLPVPVGHQPTMSLQVQSWARNSHPGNRQWKARKLNP